jgi:hypothetical protein
MTQLMTKSEIRYLQAQCPHLMTALYVAQADYISKLDMSLRCFFVETRERSLQQQSNRRPYLEGVALSF